MAQVSKRFVHPKVSERIFDVFLKAISKLRNKKEMVEFLEDFLTPTERVMLSKRLSIAYLLAQDYDYRSIGKILKVSSATVRSVALSYKYGKGGYVKQVNKILQEEELKKFFLDLGESVSGILGAGGAKATQWRTLNYEIKKKKREKPF